MGKFRPEVTNDEIETFMNGRDPFERIVNMSYDSKDKNIRVFYRNEKDEKCVSEEPFYPFCWATYLACTRLCEGNKQEVKKLMAKFSIGCKRLSNMNNDGEVIEEFSNGYLFMFYAKKPMSYQDFMRFFKMAKNPIYNNKKDKFGNPIKRPFDEEKQYLIMPPQEQYMIMTGRRFFKGYDDYDELKRLTFDLETEGIDPRVKRIIQIGVRTNKGFVKILTTTGNTKEEKDACELRNIDLFLRIIYTERPDTIIAHNGENFDWNFIIVRCNVLGTSLEAMSAKYFGGKPIHKEEKDTVLKLGGEVEKYKATIVPDIITIDSLHAVRRAQATDSNFQKGDLKYSTKYLGLKKNNRVYVQGDIISTTWKDKDNTYAFDDNNGDWYMITPDKPLKEGYSEVSGKYIVERYLGDDLWECDKVEHRLNTTNFLICKMLPIPFKKCTTMGTASQWKGLLMAWSYEHGLAIPMFKPSQTFTGGLSRLLKVGFVDKVVKLDFNSLYPSIILTWAICELANDLMGVMLKFLEYILTQREKYKGLKKAADKIVGKCEELINANATDEEKCQKMGIAIINEFSTIYQKALGDYAFNDKKQAQMKVFGNSFFGSFGAPNVFPWASVKCGEMTTCIGRQCLRLMISHFSHLGYTPIVGDSFTSDTPIYVKYKKTGEISIKPISEIINPMKVEIDALGREYD